MYHLRLGLFHSEACQETELFRVIDISLEPLQVQLVLVHHLLFNRGKHKIRMRIVNTKSAGLQNQ